MLKHDILIFMNKKEPVLTNNLSDNEGLNNYADGVMRKWGRRAIVGAAVAGFLVAAVPNGEGDSVKPEQNPVHTHVVDVNVEQLASNPQDVVVEVGQPPVPPVNYNN